MVAEQRGRERAAVRQFVAAVEAGDVDGLTECLDPLEFTGQWRAAFRRAKRLDVPPIIRHAMLQVYIHSGDVIRSSVNSDADFIAGCCALLPPYTGDAITLFRGEGAWSRRRRSYGLSWTAKEEVADGFARGLWRTCQGGSVVLRAEVPAEAIVCAPALFDDRYGEAEYIVDRWRLGRVEVVRRYEQMTPDTEAGDARVRLRRAEGTEERIEGREGSR